MSALKINNLNHQINQNLILNDISLDIEEDKITCILGPSGSGKTTLLKLIAGLEKTQKGEIHIKDKLVSSSDTHLKTESRNIGFLFQDFALFPHINAEKNIKYGMHQENINFFGEVVDTLNLKKHITKMPHELSGGQQQRVAIGRAILIKPQLILLDEPFSNLDKANVNLAKRLIVKVIEDLQIPCLLVTHGSNQSDLGLMSKEIIIS